MSHPIAFTVVSSAIPSSLSKTYKLDGERKLLQSETVANLTEGTAETIEVGSLSKFRDALTKIQSNQAFIYGVAAKPSSRLLSRKRYEELNAPEDSITRTKDMFSWPEGPGILMLDHDPKVGREQHDHESLLGALTLVSDCFAEAAHIWFPSSSSHIFCGEQDLTGLRGQRVYFAVAEASDIPRASKVLVDRLWLNGHGYCEVSKSGSLLERCLFDSNVWQTNRIDFAGGANCVSPLEQKRGEPIHSSGTILDTKIALPDLTLEELAKLKTLKQRMKAEKSTEAEQQKERYILHRAQEIADPLNETAFASAKRNIRKAIELKHLHGDFLLSLDNGEEISVERLLKNPSKYHGRLTLDPLEPEYQRNKVVGKLYLLGSRPSLHSMAHGGQTFHLFQQPTQIQLNRGRENDAVDATLQVMRVAPDLFDMGEQLVSVMDGKIHVFDENLLIWWLGRNIQYASIRFSQQNPIEVLENPPPRLAKIILSLRGLRQLKKMDGVITSATMLPDGRIINSPGYDPESRLFLDCERGPYKVPTTPGPTEIKSALNTLFAPFSKFPFCTPLDRSVALAAVLTAVVRPTIPTSPAFGFDAPSQGSGKTLLAQSIAALATGREQSVWPHISNNEEEIRKRILTILRKGTRAAVWDNVLGFFDSASIAAVLTSPEFTDRVLGASEGVTVPNRALFLVTGNNLSPAGDLPRRILLCRIDPQMERPYARSFDFSPLEYVLGNRQKMVVAALTVITGWLNKLNSGEERPASGRLASFENWDDLVRQPIAWLARSFDAGLDDPMNAIDLATASDPEQETLYELLSTMQPIFGTSEFTAKQLHEAAFNTNSFDQTDLGRILMETTGKQPSPKTLGRILSNRAGRVVHDLRLIILPPRGKSSKRYKITEVDTNQNTSQENRGV